jgi:hypothetical protein
MTRMLEQRQDKRVTTLRHFRASARARTTAEGWGMDARYVVREHDTTQTVLKWEI